MQRYVEKYKNIIDLQKKYFLHLLSVRNLSFLLPELIEWSLETYSDLLE